MALRYVCQLSAPSSTHQTLLCSAYLIVSSTVISCSADADKSPKTSPEKQHNVYKITDSPSLQLTKFVPKAITTNGKSEVMDENEVVLNGKLKRYFSLNEFKSILGEPDSSQLLSDVQPCANIFQEEDGSIDPQAKYLYKNGSRFECSKGKVAVDEIKFANGDFILFRNQKLNRTTTIVDLKALFPNAAKQIGSMDVANEGSLQVIQLREDENNVSDGHVKLFLKNGKLYSMHWWFPC